MEPVTSLCHLVFFMTGICAGFVDSIAGGGGLISVPVLLASGIPPHMALGTNKLQSSFGSMTATINYSRKGLVALSEVWVAILFTALGASLGTLVIQRISADFLRQIIPVFLAVVLVYTLATPDLGLEGRRARMGKTLFYVMAGLSLGFYDGFFGPGTGSFWTIAIVSLMGLDLKRATALTKTVNFTSNLLALLFFILGGKVLFMVGLLMGGGQIIGATLGSRMVIRRKVGFVRHVFLAVVSVTLVKLVWTNTMG